MSRGGYTAVAVTDRRWARVSLLALGLAMGFMPPGPAARAQEQTAQAAATYEFDIPSQPLAQAITALAAKTGLRVLYTEQATFNRTAPALKGAYSVEQALRTLLAGSGLVHRFTAANAVTIEAASAKGALTLDPVSVTGERPAVGEASAYAPVQGYVARRSASATKTDTPIEKTPQSITVVGRQQMQDQGIQSVAQALRYSASVATEYRGTSNLHDEMFVRGFSYVPRVLDGLTFGSTSYGKVNPYLLERVEVLRGPASVMYGQSNPSGIVAMVSKRPTGETAREVTVGYGNDNHYQTGFDVQGTAGGGKFAYRLVGAGDQLDTVEKGGEEQEIAILPSLTWTPTDATSITFNLFHQYEPAAGLRNFREAAGTVEPTKYGYIPIDFNVGDPDFDESERTQTAVGYSIEHKFNDTFSVKQNARYSETDSMMNVLTWGSLGPNQQYISRTASGGSDDRQMVALDTQGIARFGTGSLAHTVMGGLDYQYAYRDYMWGFNWSSIPAINWRNPRYGIGKVRLTTTSDTDTDADQIGVYLQDQVDIGGWTFTLGGRHDWASTEIDDHLANTTTKFDDSAFTGRAGAVYTFANGIAPYVSFSTSFEPVTEAAPAGQAAFKPNTGQQYEAGVRYVPKDMPVSVLASVYQITQQNVLTYNPVLFQNEQTGEIQSRGFELEGSADLTPNISVLGSYSYTHAEVTDSSTTANIGKMPARVPTQQASLWGKYTFHEGALKGLGLGAGVRYIGESEGDAANTFTVDAATVYDALISYDLGAQVPDLQGAAVQLNVQNLTDERYASSCSSAWACWYGTPRTVMATLTYKW